MNIYLRFTKGRLRGDKSPCRTLHFCSCLSRSLLFPLSYLSCLPPFKFSGIELLCIRNPFEIATSGSITYMIVYALQLFPTHGHIPQTISGQTISGHSCQTLHIPTLALCSFSPTLR